MNRLLIFASSAVLVSAGTIAADAATTAVVKDAGPIIQDSQAIAAADQMGHPLNMRQQIRDQLTKDGYSTTTVMPSSFFVRAKDKAGNPVEMVIGPDSFTEIADVNLKAAATATPAHQASTDEPTPAPAPK